MDQGRDTILSPALQEQVLQAVRAGAYIETAAAFAGISRHTLHAWLKKGRRYTDGRDKMPRKGTRARARAELYMAFVTTIEKAMAEEQLRHLLLIEKAAKGEPPQFDKDGNMISPGLTPQWTAAAWRLERKYPHLWGRRDVVAVADDRTERNARGLLVKIVQSRETPARALEPGIIEAEVTDAQPKGGNGHADDVDVEVGPDIETS